MPAPPLTSEATSYNNLLWGGFFQCLLWQGKELSIPTWGNCFFSWIQKLGFWEEGGKWERISFYFVSAERKEITVNRLSWQFNPGVAAMIWIPGTELFSVFSFFPGVGIHQSLPPCLPLSSGQNTVKGVGFWVGRFESKSHILLPMSSQQICEPWFPNMSKDLHNTYFRGLWKELNTMVCLKMLP